MKNISRVLLLGLGSLLLFTQSLRAWNADGHMVSAQIAYNHLTPAAKARADFLISQPVFGVGANNNTFTTTGPWADDIKSLTNYFNNWHFIDLPFSYDGTSTNGFVVPSDNVVWAISNCITALQDPTTSVSNQAINLRFLIHFVSDLQQPLHASDAVWAGHTGGDAGGNGFSLSGSPNNLHSLWDQGAGYVNDFEPRPLDATGLETLSNRVYDVESVYPYSPVFTTIPNVMDWAIEGWYLAQTNAYVGVTPGGSPSAAYLTKVQNTTRQRMAVAGQRLADLINILLVPKVVVNNLDSGPGSLRYVVSNASSGDTILFTNTLSGQTILLTNGPITLNNNLTIDASSLSNGMCINGNRKSSVFTITSGTVVLAGLTITNGWETNGTGGGGIYISSPGVNVTLTNCAVTGNMTTNSGGGIYSFGSLTLNNCFIAGNKATNGQGGGLLCYGSIAINNCTLTNNFATNGGGFYNNGTLTLSNSTIAGNSSVIGAGGIENYGPLQVFACTLANNIGKGGGAIDNNHFLAAYNSTFFGNSATANPGSAIWAGGSNVVVNCTFSGNTGAAAIAQSASAPIAITNSIVASNPNGNISGTFSGANNYTGSAPLLAALGDHGGPTKTMPPLPGSPAIDAGSDVVTNLFTADQRGAGFTRKNGAHVDIGAVESGSPIPGFVAVVTTAADGDLANGVSLREAVAFASNNATITFASNLSGQTIFVTNGNLIVNKNLTIDGSTLASQVKLNGGHANRFFFITNAAVMLDSLTLTNGYDNGADGGGAVINYGNLAVNRCTFAGNSCGNAGGAINANAGTLTVSNSTFFNNTCGYAGGAVISYSPMAMSQCTVASNNAAGYGGGIMVWSSNVWVSQCTVVSNSSPGGGGVYQFIGELALTNTIVARNSSGGNNLDNLRNENPVIFGGVNITNGVPLLAPLGNYGGPTPTMPPLEGSPAINGCTNGTSFITDQRGLQRIVGAFADVGAAEAQIFPPAVTTLPASDLASSTGTLNGTVTPNGGNTTAWFQWGATIAYGNQTAPVVLGNGNAPLPASALITGLTPGITYHCRLVASNSFGLTQGGDVAFVSQAAPYGATNIVVVRVGTGTGSEINSGNPVFLDEFSASGTLVQSIALPTAQSGSQFPLILAGTSAAEGFITRSVDGRYLLLSGYGTNTGGSALAGTASASVPRVIARVDWNGNVDTSTALTNWTSANSPRCAASLDGSQFWGSGGAGLNYASALGLSNSVVLNSGNFRNIGIFNNQIYISSAAAAVTRGIASVGSGLPTTTGQTATILPGLTDNVSLKSPYGFFFCHLNGAGTAPDTLYVCDDTTTGPPGGITKFSLVGGSWVSNSIAGAAADSYRGLCGIVNGTTVTLFATRKGGSTSTGGGELVRLVDTTGYNAPFISPTITLLATAAANTAFRGVSLAPSVSTVVTNLADGGPGSLRQIMQDAATNATITFATNLSGKTILLTNGALQMIKNFNIDASALPNGIIIDGNHTGTSGVFDSIAGITNVFTALTITNGVADPLAGGGGIVSRGTLTLNRCSVVGNSSGAGGGGIWNEGVLSVNNCTFANNNNEAILNFFDLTINNSTIANNEYGIYSGDTLRLTNSIVSGNSYGDLDFDGNFSGLNNLASVDPINLAPLGNYGGATPSMPPLPGSPAIDAGDDTAASQFATDQRGLARVAGAHVDIGAVESGNAIPGYTYGTVVNTNADLLPNEFETNIVSLRSAVAFATNNATITFVTNLSGQTILLTGGALQMNKNFNIDASALPRGIIINGNHTGNNGIFDSVSGITNVFTALTLTNGAASPAAGGGAIVSRGNLTLNRCTLVRNSSGYGGAVYSEGNLQLNQCTLTGNSAVHFGGAIENLSGKVTVNQCTLTGNSASQGGGIMVFSSCAITNCIVAGNSAPSGGDISSSGATAYGGSNIVQGYNGNPASGPDAINAAPRLAALGNYGGPTPTMPPLPGSPAIDAGSDSAASQFTIDQRGFARIAGAHVDIGAVELTITEAVFGLGKILGNGSNGFGGSIGLGSLTLTDDGTNIYGTLYRGPDTFRDNLVIYIDSVSGGFANTASFADGADGLRKAISGFDGGSNRSVLTNLPGFTADYAIALGPNSEQFGGLWKLSAGGNNSLQFSNNVNLTPLTNNAAFYTFSFPVASIGLSPGGGGTFRLFGTLISSTGFRANEALPGNVSGAQGWSPFNVTAVTNYTIHGTVLPVTPPLLTGVGQLGNGSFQFNFTNVSGASFTIFGSTNVTWPIDAWSNLGAAVESPASSGQYQFTDPQATNSGQRFYRVRSP